MAAAYSMDLRERVIAARLSGEKTGEVSSRFSVSPAWVRRLMQRRRDLGRIAPLDGKRGRKPKLVQHSERLRALVLKHPDATLRELHAQLQADVCIATLWAALRKLKLSFKKSPSRLGTATS